MGRTMLQTAHRSGVRRQLRPTCPIWGLLLKLSQRYGVVVFRGLGWSPQGLGPLAMCFPVAAVARRTQTATVSGARHMAPRMGYGCLTTSSPGRLESRPGRNLHRTCGRRHVKSDRSWLWRAKLERSTARTIGTVYPVTCAISSSVSPARWAITIALANASRDVA